MTKQIIVFSGGRGTARVVEALLDRRQQGLLDFELTMVVNAYDNGSSTGVVRRLFGVLGPSDVRKNMWTLLDRTAPGGQAAADFFDLRFGEEDDNDRRHEWEILEAMVQVRNEVLQGYRKGQVFLALSEPFRELVSGGLAVFMEVANSRGRELGIWATSAS